jgi:hypothetical protein
MASCSSLGSRWRNRRWPSTWPRRVTTLQVRAGAHSFAIICRTSPPSTVRGPGHWFSPALRPRDRSASSARAGLDQRDGTPTADWIAQQITEAFPWDEAPRYMIRDRDAVYGAVVTRRLRAMGIRDRPISAGSPWQNGFAERLIGTIRPECVDHLVVFGEAHLRRVLIKFAAYYNECRIHRALNKDAPFHRAIELLGAITTRPVLGGLHYQYCRA